MSKTVDNIIAYRIISMLVKPFKDTDAFKEGIIDERGKILKKANKLTTTKEKNAYTFLHRLIFKLKQFVEKAPGGKTRLGSLAAAYYLIREAYEGQESVHILREKYEDLISKDISLLEEELLVEEVIEHLYWNMFNIEAKSPAQQAAIAISMKKAGKKPKDQTDEEVAANSVSGGGVDLSPTVRMKKGRKFATFQVSGDVLKKFKSGKKKYSKWKEYLNMSDDTQSAIYNYARKNPKGVIVLQTKEGDTKAIRFNRNGGGSWRHIKRPVARSVGKSTMLNQPNDIVVSTTAL
jgi:hypothetical protein|tara:strand:- start:9473 stop:10348 length:876 start_codon:yes stop_codon:yes gene_type:complete